MGNNRAFTEFEHITIAVYNRGFLDAPLMAEIMEAYRDCDIDSGGMAGTVTNDGHDIYQVIAKTHGHELPVKPDLPTDYRDWTAEQDAANEAYHESLHEIVYAIRKQHGWY